MRDREPWMQAYRVQRKDEFDLVEKGIQECQLVLTSKIPKAFVEVARALLLRRAMNGVSAMTTLASYGYTTEVRIQYRSVLEAIMRMTALCLDPELFNDYRAQGELANLGMAKDLLNLRTKSQMSAEEEPTEEQITSMIDLLDRRIAEADGLYPRKMKKKIEGYEWAEKAGLVSLYWGHYASLSLAVHHSLQDNERHLERGGDGTITGIEIGPERDEAIRFLLDATQALFGAVRAFVKTTQQSMPGSYIRVAGEAHRRYVAMFKGAKGGRSV